MKLTRLAAIFAVKYAASPEHLESAVRKKIDMLWSYPNKQFNILRSCADAGVANAKTPHEMKAFAGYKFCQEVVSLIDYLKSNQDMSLGALRDVLLKLINLISENKDLKFTGTGRISEKGMQDTVLPIQFPTVSALISEMFPPRKKHDVKLRDEYQGKARAGLGRILGLSTQMMDDLKELEIMVPEKFSFNNEEDINQEGNFRFKPQRAMLSPADIIKFIREHGNEYRVRNTDDWTLLARSPELIDKLTHTISALFNGQVPRNAAEVKSEIEEVLNPHKDRENLSNKHLFQETEQN